MLKLLCRVAAFAIALGWGGAWAQWDYTTSTDPMTSVVVQYAEIASKNSMSLDFPYKGKNHGHLILRRKGARAPVEVIVKIDKGQIMSCRVESCPVQVRFDDAPPITMTAIGSTDNSSRVIFINNARQFFERARKAKHIKVAVTLFQNGVQVLEFDAPQALIWK